MLLGVRTGWLAIMLILSAVSAAAAEDAKPSEWKDPPIRGAAGPATATPSKPETNPAGSAKAADKGAVSKTSEASKSATAPRRYRSARLRRERIRQAAVRTRVYARSAMRTRSRSSHAMAASGASSGQLRAEARAIRTRSARRFQTAANSGFEGGYANRRGGWSGLLGTGRERRIAEAEEDDDPVVRSPRIVFPSGAFTHAFRSFDPYDLD